MRNLLKTSLFALFAIALASCSQSLQEPEPTFYDTFPSNARTIVSTNADALLKAAGCDSKQGSIKLTAGVAEAITLADSSALPLIEAVANCGDRIDLQQVVLVELANGNLLSISKIKPGVEKLCEDGEIIEGNTRLGDFLCCTLDSEKGISAAIAHDWVWIARESEERLPIIADSLHDIARMHNVADSPTLMTLLKENADFLIIKHAKISDNPLGDDFDAIVARLIVGDRKLTAKAWAMRAARKVDAFSKMGVVDASLMGDMPLASMFAAAVALTPESKQWTDSLAMLAPVPERFFASMILSWVNPEGGTFAIGLAPGGSAETIRHFSLDSWMAKVALPLPPQQTESLTSETSVPGSNLFCHTDSSYIYLSNYDSDTNPDGNDLTPSNYAEANALASLHIPYRSQVMKALGIANGYQAEVVCADSTLTATLSISGRSGYILPAVLADLKRLNIK